MQHRNFTPFPVLDTERLTLRQLVPSDAEALFALRSDESVNKYLSRKPSTSIDDAEAFIHVINQNIERNDSLYWAIVLNGTDRLIGAICLFDFSEEHSSAEIGYELSPAFQGKGLMQEATSRVIDFAFAHIGLNAIEASMHVQNQSSRTLAEKLNFKQRDADKDLLNFRLTQE